MLKEGSKSSLKARVLFCSLATGFFGCFFPARAIFASCGPHVIWNLGATEYGNALSQLFSISNVDCPDGVLTDFGNTDSTDFTISNPPTSSGYSGCLPCNPPATFGPGCIPDYTLDDGDSCVFMVTFTPPKSLDAGSTVISLTISNNPTTTYSIYGAGFSLSTQNGLNNFPLMLPESQTTASSGFASITIDSGNAKIKWDPTLEYQSIGRFPPTPASVPMDSFDTTSTSSYTLGFGTPIPEATPTPTKTYQVAGGQLTLKATYSAPGVAVNPAKFNNPATSMLKATVTGIPGTPSGIPVAVLTNKLSTVYASLNGGTPPTKNLFEGIAAQETGGGVLNEAKQFANTTLYNVQSFWPYGNVPAPAGKYIGLMQDQLLNGKTAMPTAWDWQANVDTAYSIFTGKVTAVLKVKTAAHKANKYVPLAAGTGALSPLQIEEMALFQYGGNLPQKDPNLLPNQLLTPQCVGGADDGEECNKSCTCQWQENLTDTPLLIEGENYVCAIYGIVGTNVPDFC